MDARSELEALCRRHGVPPALGLRLLPLVERAQDSVPTVRRRLLALVEEALAREAAELRELDRLQADLERRMLGAVAQVLHAWAGPGALEPPPSGPERDAPG